MFRSVKTTSSNTFTMESLSFIWPILINLVWVTLHFVKSCSWALPSRKSVSRRANERHSWSLHVGEISCEFSKDQIFCLKESSFDMFWAFLVPFISIALCHCFESFFSSVKLEKHFCHYLWELNWIIFHHFHCYQHVVDIFQIHGSTFSRFSRPSLLIGILKQALKRAENWSSPW